MIQTLLAAAYVLVIANITIMPTLLPYMRQDIVMSDTDAALILAFFSVVAIPANLLGGILSDKYERGPFLTIGACICSLSFLAMATLNSVTGIILSRGVCAVGMAMVASAIFPSVGDRFSPDQRSRATAFVMGGSSLAPLVWQPLCALLGGSGHWRSFVLMLSVFAALVALAARSCLPGIGRPSPGLNEGLFAQVLELKETAIERRVGNALVAYCLCALATSLFTAMYPTWVHDGGISSTNAAVIFMCGGVGSLVAAVGLGRGPGKKASAVLVSVSSCAAMAFCIIAMRASGTAVVLQALLFMCLFAARSAYLAVTVSSLMTVVRSSQRGAINGLLSVTFQSAVAIGSGCGVFVYQSDPSFSATAIGALTLLGLTVLVQYRGHCLTDENSPMSDTNGDPATRNQVAR